MILQCLIELVHLSGCSGLAKSHTTPAALLSLPDGIQTHSFILIIGQLGDKGEMADLNGGPAKLENDDGDGEIEHLEPEMGTQVVSQAEQAIVPDEEEGNSHHGGSNEVTEFPPPIANVDLVNQKSNDGRGQCVRHLTNEDEHTCIDVPQQHHLVVEEDQVSEPHTGTHVIEDMANTIGKLSDDGEATTSLLSSDFSISDDVGSPPYDLARAWVPCPCYRVVTWGRTLGHRLPSLAHTFSDLLRY